MPEYSGFFTAEYDENGDYDRKYTAEQFAYYFSKFIGNGVYAIPSEQLQVHQNSSKNMSVNIAIGDAYINGYFYKNTTVASLPIDIASGSFDRIDMVVLRWEKITRKINLAILKGVEAAQAEPPILTRNENIYELCLAKVLINRATMGITDALIQDTRGDNSLCGFVHGVVDQVETTELWKQYESKFEQMYEKYNAALEDWSTNLDDGYFIFVKEYGDRFDSWFSDLTRKWKQSEYGEMVSKIETIYRRIPITINTIDWEPHEDERNDKIHFKYEYEDERCGDDTFANVIFSVDSLEEANKCGILPTCEVKRNEFDTMGTVTLYATSVPVKALNADMYFND